MFDRFDRMLGDWTNKFKLEFRNLDDLLCWIDFYFPIEGYDLDGGWTDEQNQQFIESIWLGLPMQTYTIAETPSGHYVVDGYKRILAIRRYVYNEFKVSGLLWKDLNDREQTRFKRTAFIGYRTVSPTNKDLERIEKDMKRTKPKIEYMQFYQDKAGKWRWRLKDYDSVTWREDRGFLGASSRGFKKKKETIDNLFEFLDAFNVEEFFEDAKGEWRWRLSDVTSNPNCPILKGCSCIGFKTTFEAVNNYLSVKSKIQDYINTGDFK